LIRTGRKKKTASMRREIPYALKVNRFGLL
jgi:hypothetical protein